jgi:hypothetical protein
MAKRQRWCDDRIVDCDNKRMALLWKYVLERVVVMCVALRRNRRGTGAGMTGQGAIIKKGTLGRRVGVIGHSHWGRVMKGGVWCVVCGVWCVCVSVSIVLAEQPGTGNQDSVRIVGICTVDQTARRARARADKEGKSGARAPSPL